ncbi:DUF7283 family protein [Natronorubrum sulfidifaciens]|uniref:Uncharacterized protein n=1 Tax=Natronorubrum sulfidifaciens JCM 14089 TaxID=1230460 RepID=L9WIZ9_9EURY|nr:hypothetical protein [Natronorubrum sulfidifaciens]ELY49424.1 hypothetical protein C495_00625 [Natronorubrum sulfidifaciens JCM 14089]
MDWEAPADAWFVWVAVALVSVAVAGLALSFPTGLPPDANQAANTIERTTGSIHDASASYDHDADEVKFDRPTVSLRNEHGTTHSSLAYGSFVPVLGDERLETIAHGTPIESEYSDAHQSDQRDAGGEFLEDVVAAAEDNGEWQTANGELAVRTVRVEAGSVHAVSARGTAPDDPSGRSSYATDVSITHTVDPGRELEFVFSGTRHANHGTDPQTREATTTVRADETGEVDIELFPDDESDTNALRYPIELEVSVDGSRACSGTLERDGRSRDLCSTGPTADDVASDVDWLTRHPETGAYHVTIVSA